MSLKVEIERRLKKKDYLAMSRELFGKAFDDLNNDQYNDILKVADVYGAKYKKFYKLKDTADIRTITSNLVNKTYTPDFNIHFDLNIIGIHKTDTSFTIYSEFYTTEDEWLEVDQNGKRFKEFKRTSFRRIMVLEKSSNTNYLIISIDPIGEGLNVYKELDKNIKLVNIDIGLNLNDFFDNIEIDKAIFELNNNGKFIPNKVIAKDESTNRVKSVFSQSAKDNIKDEDIFVDCKKSDLLLQNMKMKFNKESLEVFGKTILKISTRSNKKITDELTKNITSIL